MQVDLNEAFQAGCDAAVDEILGEIEKTAGYTVGGVPHLTSEKLTSRIARYGRKAKGAVTEHAKTHGKKYGIGAAAVGSAGAGAGAVAGYDKYKKSKR